MNEKAPIYAIGDINGRSDLLKQMLGTIAILAGKMPYRIVCLGNYLGGPDSRGVLQALFEANIYQSNVNQSNEPVFLKGEREVALWHVLTDQSVERTRRWLAKQNSGAKATLQSYGIDSPARNDSYSLESLPDRLWRAMPPAHQIILGRMPDRHVTQDHFFCHAGINPKVRLTDQTEADLVHGNRGFRTNATTYERVIVHSHWDQLYDPAQPDRICIPADHGGNGRLSAARIERGKPQFLHLQKP